MLKIESSAISVSTFRLKNLEQTMIKMIELDKNFDYSVAWLDTLSTAEKLGRSVITAGNHATNDDLSKEYINENVLQFKTTAPASANDSGIVGQIRMTTNFIYICIATNTWVRKAAAW